MNERVREKESFFLIPQHQCESSKESESLAIYFKGRYASAFHQHGGYRKTSHLTVVHRISSLVCCKSSSGALLKTPEFAGGLIRLPPA